MKENVLYLLVNWLDGKTYVVQNVSCLINEKMLKDPKLVGLVKWIREIKNLRKVEINMRQRSSQWMVSVFKKYINKVLYVIKLKTEWLI